MRQLGARGQVKVKVFREPEPETTRSLRRSIYFEGFLVRRAKIVLPLTF